MYTLRLDLYTRLGDLIQNDNYTAYSCGLW